MRFAIRENVPAIARRTLRALSTLADNGLAVQMWWLRRGVGAGVCFFAQRGVNESDRPRACERGGGGDGEGMWARSDVAMGGGFLLPDFPHLFFKTLFEHDF